MTRRERAAPVAETWAGHGWPMCAAAAIVPRSTQLSYGGHPLYTYVHDITPDMVTGQAIDHNGDLWYVIDAECKQITTPFTVTTPQANG